ncbi:MAG TPA: glycoside hydrolase family 2 TIM barrel-domain containing protein [Verrucomicrobiae bacterium]|nr:glycoside hydrolase family 2 TIM barrel-domain containing protein [Verrucomicrobiae bacterium]
MNSTSRAIKELAPPSSRTPRLCLFFLNLMAAWSLLAQATPPVENPQTSGRQETLFDRGWRFHRGGAQGAEASFFDDSSWRAVDLPHDWSVEDLPGADSPFDRDAISQVSGGFTVGGTGWYRKAFTLPADAKGRRVIVEFDGAYMNAKVWLNGGELGTHPYGYTPFWFDITDKVSLTGTNWLTVKISNEGENSRWYSGSGIYRHVWLRFLNPVHVAHDGIYIATPRIDSGSAQVRIQMRLANQSPSATRIRVMNRVLGTRGEEVTRAETEQAVAAKDMQEVTQELVVQNPGLWSVEHPVLYTNITELYQDQQLLDRLATPFGFRQIRFDLERGFSLNGQPLKLQGGCLHHDNGPLGAKSYDRAEERKVEILKAGGFNAVRCAHNPPAPAFLDACDRLGLLVLDEAFDMWDIGKNPNDYHLSFRDWWEKDLRNMVERDRNHPSVILWSIGNEIPGKETPAVAESAKTLSAFVRKLDPTRPVTAAVNSLSPDKDPFFAALDVGGYNYAVGGDHGIKDVYAVDHERVPSRIMVCTESYPLDTFASWMAVLDHPYVVGDFVWTAWDYLGEASIGWRGYDQFHDFFPWNLAFCGDIDICGWRRPQSFYRQTVWQKDRLSIFVHPPRPSFPENPLRKDWSRWHFDDLVGRWNWETNATEPLLVTVFSSCREVELFLNGKSLGRKPTNRATQFKAVWDVAYAAGKLEVVGYDERSRVARAELRTAAAPSLIRLTPDRSSLRPTGEDLSYVTVELVDAYGLINPEAENVVRFELEGPGKIVGVGNANPISLESYQKPERKCWHGRCLVIVKGREESGRLVLRATSDKLPSSQVILSVSP